MDFSKLFSLEGRVAVITGGSRGIGRMLAEGFLAAGCAKVYITARKAAVVEETARELGDRVIALPGDISTLAGIEALAEDLAKLEPRSTSWSTTPAWRGARTSRTSPKAAGTR
jgi:NAD(P)-dependent dehydrogenase (short-subunit alcohol dehydrogenase family)